MKRLVAMVVGLGAAALVGIARGGHELPIYPSFYPHEIEIRSLAPAEAARAIPEGRIPAYVGDGMSFSGTPPGELQAIPRRELITSVTSPVSNTTVRPMSTSPCRPSSK